MKQRRKEVQVEILNKRVREDVTRKVMLKQRPMEQRGRLRHYVRKMFLEGRVMAQGLAGFSGRVPCVMGGCGF
jgi:hypothetical protein